MLTRGHGFIGLHTADVLTIYHIPGHQPPRISLSHSGARIVCCLFWWRFVFVQGFRIRSVF